MDAGEFDQLTSRLTAHLTRRRGLGILGALGLGGLATEAAAKKKTKNKCKRGCAPCQVCKKKKRTKKCVAAPNGTACNGGTCQNGGCAAAATTTTLAPNPCAGKADGPTPACGAIHVCSTPLGICGKACSGEVCAEIPTCKEPHDPCGENCCDPAGVACASFPATQCGCSSVGNPCFSSDGCCGPGICVGFVCRLP